jgi:hypothetical protein
MMRIDGTNVTDLDGVSESYLFDRPDLTSAAAVETGEAEEFDDAPYSQTASAVSAPSLSGGWKELLGLNQVTPGPSQIGPPPRPASFEGDTAANSANRNLLRDGAGGRDAVSSSPRVGRMMDLIDAYQRTAGRIRARASDGGQ